MAENNGKWKTMDYHVTPSDSYEKQSQALFEAVWDTPGINYLLDQKIMTPQEIRSNIWQVKGWLDAISPCEGCKGLSQCRQPKKGYHMELVYDGILHKNMVMCRYRKEQENRRQHLGSIVINEMPESMYEVSFQTIDLKHPDNCDASYLKVFKHAVEACEKHESLFLYGGMGTGKTYLACCAVNEVAGKGERCAFLSWPLFTARAAAMVRSGEYRDLIRLLVYIPFLVIDDIGAEKVTEWNRDELLFPILDGRMNNHKPTWFTSNHDMTTLDEHFSAVYNKDEPLKGKRIMERVRTIAESEALTGKDRRKKH